MEEYEQAGEAFGRLLNTCKYPRVILVCLTTIIPIYIGLKFLFA